MIAVFPPAVTITFVSYFFFFQAEDGIRDHCVTGVQTCALPIYHESLLPVPAHLDPGAHRGAELGADDPAADDVAAGGVRHRAVDERGVAGRRRQIGRASCRERVEHAGVAGSLKKRKSSADSAQY